VRIRVWGKDWRELFEVAAKGMVSLIVDLNSVLEKEKRVVKIEGENGEELLLRWLREILFVMEQGGMVFSNFRVERDNFSYKNVDRYWFYGSLMGEKADPSRHGICSEIKAVTRHGLFVEEKGTLWETRILFDL